MNDDPKKISVKELISIEYKKCVQSPAYFIKKYCYIQHPTKSRMLFALYGYQERAIGDFEKNQFNIILKGRQIGISTVVACYSLWMMLFHKDKNVTVISTKEETAKNIIIKVKFAYDHLPVWLRHPLIENNKLSLRFENGSQIKAQTSSENAARSEALSLLILDEAAFIKSAREIWVAAAPALSTGGRAIIISTPNGMGNFFHQMWLKADDKEGILSIDGNDTIEKETSESLEKTPDDMKINPIKLDWTVHPERDLAWRKKMGKIQGEREARQEYDAEFIGSGNTVFDSDMIEELAKRISEPQRMEYRDKNLWIWKEPDYTHTYIVCADVARGDAKDKSAFHVIDAETCEQVAEYRGLIATKDYGHLLIAVATRYNDALLLIENATLGLATMQVVLDRNYKNIFYMNKDIRYLDDSQPQNNNIYAEEKKAIPGFTMSGKTRPLIIAKLNDYLEEQERESSEGIKINSIRTINEMRVFIWRQGMIQAKAEAMEGYNDDLVLSMAMGLWVRDTALKLADNRKELTRMALNRFAVRPQHEEQSFYMPGGLLADPYKLNVGGKPNPYTEEGQEDLRWLLG